MIIQCRNDICVYWKGDKCTLDSIALNEIGICEEYISVNIPVQEFENYRRKHLDELSKRD